MENKDRPTSPITSAPFDADESYLKVSDPLLGLTKREDFAKSAMQGIVASGAHEKYSEAGIACLAVTQADALLKALESE